MSILYPRDRIRTVIEWGCFRNKRGYLIEMQGARPLVKFDDYIAPVLLFAGEAVLDESTLNLTGAE